MIKNIWISEWERMFKRKKTWVGISIYLALIGLEALFLFGVGVSFYNQDAVVELNSLNTAPFFIRELGLVLSFIIIPMFVVDSFNGEYTSGAYRLVLLRPQGRTLLFTIKLAVQATVIWGLLAVTALVGTMFGKLVFPNVEDVSFFNTGIFQPYQASLYVLLFYFIVFLIMVAVICLGSAVSSIMPNPILAYIGIVGLLIGSIYVSDQFFFFLTVSDSVFEILGEQQLDLFLLIVSLSLVSYIISLVVWKKRDWLG